MLEREVEPALETSRLRGAILIFPGVEELDFVGVYEVLTKARAMANEGRLALEQPPHVLLLDREQRVPCANGLVVQPHHRYAGLAGFDFAVVPGGRGINALQNDDALLAELSRFQKIGGLLCSVCTGALALAWMQALVDIQREDGGWRPFWAEESSPVYTALAVKALILSGMLARGDLEADVKAYAV